MSTWRRMAGVLAALGLLAACGDDGPAVTAPTDPTAVTTTTVETTSTVASADSPFIGGCEDYQRDDGASPGPAEADLDTFGPLAAVPGLTITLPMVQLIEPFPSRPGAVRIPGGVLVSASTEAPYPMNFGSPPSMGMMVAAIDLDGEVRWVRCFDRPGGIAAAAPSTEAPTSAYVVFTEPGDESSTEAHKLDLADGTVDKEILTLPPSVGSGSGPAVEYSADAATVLRATAADGSTLWEDRTIVHPGREADPTKDAGDVVVVVGCLADASGSAAGCATEVMRGYREADGKVLWERAGAFTLSVAGDGVALVSELDPAGDSPWTMIDASSGKNVPGQTFSGGVGFFPSCCADTSRGVFLTGGVVIAYAGGVVNAWYPADAGIDPHQISLP